jgi:hypothetical protein
MEENQILITLHSAENTMHEEPILIHRELYQACKCDGGIRMFKTRGLSHVDLFFQNTMRSADPPDRSQKDDIYRF